MATLKLSPEARAKRLVKKVEAVPVKQLTGYELHLEDQRQVQMDRIRAKEWLDSRFPLLFKDKKIPFEIGIAKQIKGMRPEGMRASSIGYWFDLHCKTPEYREVKQAAEEGRIVRSKLEQFL